MNNQASFTCNCDIDVFWECTFPFRYFTLGVISVKAYRPCFTGIFVFFITLALRFEPSRFFLQGKMGSLILLGSKRIRPTIFCLHLDYRSFRLVSSLQQLILYLYYRSFRLVSSLQQLILYLYYRSFRLVSSLQQLILYLYYRSFRYKQFATANSLFILQVL